MLNTTSNLNKTEWLNLVFKNRNQAYGAYELRLHSDQNTLRALFIAAPLFILLFASPMIYKYLHPETTVDDARPDIPVTMAPIHPPIEQTKPLEKVEPPKSEPIKEKIKMVKLPSNPVVVVNKPLVVEPPTADEMENAVVGPVTQTGKETDLTSLPAEGNGTGPGTVSGSGTEETIYDGTSVEIYPDFEGGMKGWAKYLQRNLRYPYDAQEQDKQGKVFVSFVVEKDGSISNVTLVKGVFGSLDAEAVRVIKKSPKWKPGIQNGRAVRVRYNMPISFALSQ
ncbi:MAG TPA: TonB family protein [Pedobacter sp.]|uniref:energy transducer TonB n=1 Tax=Pedobacter sp. TaxID=1411316 RepID=UPI002CC89FA3|nr:TonB family protein [Pedobacter sp.]HMI05051.1 TonB family protein [Pedobacter sp.]